MNRVSRGLERFCSILIRGVFPLLVLLCVLVFPAYKGVWAGYLPVVLGLGLGVAALAGRDRWREYVGGWSRGRDMLWLYLLPALVQVMLVVLFRPEARFDGLFVYQQADVFVRTGAMDPMTYYPPAQTWWYAGWFAVFGVSTLVAQLSHIPLSLGVTWATRGLAGAVSENASAARLAALAVAWYPSFLGYVLTTPYYHYLYTFLTVGMVWGLMAGFRVQVSGFRRSEGRLFLLAGVAAGLGALTKAVQLIAPLQVVTWLGVWLAIHGGGERDARVPWGRVSGLLAVFLVGMGMVLAPWMVRNYQVFDAVVPVCTSGGLVLYSANHPGSNGLYSGLPDDVALETPEEMLAHSKASSARAKTFMREQPGAFLGLAWRKFLHTWGGEATFAELINYRGRHPARMEDGFSLAFYLGWTTLVGAWGLGSFLAWRRRCPLGAFELLAGVILLSNAAVYMVFEGGDRHHLPLVPLLVVIGMERWAGRSCRPEGGSGRQPSPI